MGKVEVFSTWAENMWGNVGKCDVMPALFNRHIPGILKKKLYFKGMMMPSLVSHKMYLPGVYGESVLRMASINK
jgi:hypothetical protein